MNIPGGMLRLRRVVQALVLAGLCVLPWANAQGWKDIMGNFYALYVGGVPFADPLTAAQSLATGYMPGWKLGLGAGLALALAFVLGRVFCGWICPYGLLSELLWQWRGRKQGKLREGWAWGVRAVVTLAGLAGTAWLGLPLLNALSAPGNISLLPLLGQAGWEIVELCAVFVAALLVLDALLGTRWWCRYVCPQALLLMIMADPSGRSVWAGLARAGRRPRYAPRGMLAVRWTAAQCTCKGETPCAVACSLGLRPRHKAGPPVAHCVQCGECVTACAARGKALRLGMGNIFEAGRKE